MVTIWTVKMVTIWTVLRTSMVTIWTVQTVTIWTVLLVTVDRYMAVCRPFDTRMRTDLHVICCTGR